MDKRTQRLLLVALLLGVCFLLYRSSDGYEALRQPTSGSNVPNADHDLDLNALEPANATLGVSLLSRHSILSMRRRSDAHTVAA